jgi:pimeloyl-ACP methyl ester carboxylesterase
MRTHSELRDGLAVYRFGEGPPLLLIPYPMAAFVVGDPVLDALIVGITSLGFSCITFDPPGSGKSTRQPDCSLAEMLDCTLQALDAFRIDSPVSVLAHSQATLVALALAEQHPDRVTSLILGGASARSPRGAQGSFSHSSHPAFPGLAVRLALFSITRRLAAQKHLYNYVLRQSFFDTSLAPQIPVHQGDWLRPLWIRYRWLQEGAQARIHPKQLHQPVLLLSGSQDRLVPEALTLELAGCLANVARFLGVPAKEPSQASWGT